MGDLLEKEMAIHSTTIAWKIPWTEELGRLQSMGLQRVIHDWVTLSFHLNILWHCLSLGLEWKLTFHSCGHCWVFQICWHIECSIFTTSSFRIWNSSAGIPSHPLALFIVMFPKAHQTSSRWVITPLWLSRSWRSFLYSSSGYSYHLFLVFCFC